MEKMTTVKKQIQKIKILLMKIKKGLLEENLQNKEMIKNYHKMVNKTATKEEINQANNQFKSLLKSIGLGFLIILPLAPISLPFYIKLGKMLNIDLLPSWAKNEEVDHEKNKFS